MSSRAPVDMRRRRLVGGLTAMALRVPPAAARPPRRVGLAVDARLAGYGFPPPHPFGADRQAAFLREAQSLLAQSVSVPARAASDEELRRFHTRTYVAQVRAAAARGIMALDGGDTPVFPAIHDAAATVVGSALDTCARIVAGDLACSLQPIGGLHHARRDAAAGFCVYNDCGVVIETLRRVHGVRRIAYVDIDAHHGDGVFYAFESDPDLVFADIHQDSRTLFPGTGRAEETGQGAARGTKLNIELPPGAGDDDFKAAFVRVEEHLLRHAPAFFLFQCGADGLAGDPLAQLAYTPAAHAHAARRLRALAARLAGGRLMAFGGGGYGRGNLARAWREVLVALLASS